MSKRMNAIRKEVSKHEAYAINDAIKLLKKHTTKFVQSVDVAAMLGIDPKKSDQVVRGVSPLPHGTGRDIRVAVFAQGALAEAAKQAGAEYVGFEDLAEEIKQKAEAGKIDFNILIATPDAMRIVDQLGRILGPKGLMPNPKLGTVTMDVAKAVKDAKGGQVTFRADKSGIVHSTIGKLNFEDSALKENLERIISDIKKAKPSTSKGVYLKKIYISSSMGPGLLVDLSSLTV